jgi:hypothetical protein
MGTDRVQDAGGGNLKKRYEMEAFKIVLFATLAAIGYGILHDQVTAHLCVEYFTIAHPPVFPTFSPFWLAIGWGIIATWWVGLPFGVMLAVAARVGPRPKFRLADLRRPIVLLMLFSATMALLAGSLGALLVATHMLSVPNGWAEVIPPDKHVAFSADAWAHGASYVSGALGGLFVIGRTIWLRLRSAAPMAA